MSSPERLPPALGPPQPESRHENDREAARRKRAARRAGRGSVAAPERPRAPAPRAGRFESRDGASTASRGRSGGNGRPPGGGGSSGRGRGDARRRRLLAVALGVGLLVLVWLFVGFWAPFAGEGDDPVRVRIPQGAGVQQIGEILDERGVVPSAAVFSLRVRLSGRGSELKPGNYRLRSSMSYGSVLAALAEGPARNVVNVTIPEGRARGEIAPIVDEAGLEGSYARASARAPGLDPGDYGAPNADSLEGFLYPSTYELARGASSRDLVARQLEAFKREFGSVDLSAAKGKNLSPYEVLVIASMIEREAQLDRERPLIASVIYNRLSKGEPLGIDATTRFAVKNWDEPLKQSELAVDSPYNTRLNAGLPPGPIGNPGRESIRAAAKPAKSGGLFFYVVKPNTCGEHAFSRTIEEFTRDSQTYNAERAARGGQSPQDCPA